MLHVLEQLSNLIWKFSSALGINFSFSEYLLDNALSGLLISNFVCNLNEIVEYGILMMFLCILVFLNESEFFYGYYMMCF